MQGGKKGAPEIGQLVSHRRYGAGTVRSLFARYALVEFDRPFLEKTVPLDHLHALHEAGEMLGRRER